MSAVALIFAVWIAVAGLSSASLAASGKDCAVHGVLSPETSRNGNRVTVKALLTEALPLEQYHLSFEYTQFKGENPILYGSGDGSIQTNVSGTVLTPGFVTSKRFKTKFKFIVENASNRCVARGVVKSMKAK